MGETSPSQPLTGLEPKTGQGWSSDIQYNLQRGILDCSDSLPLRPFKLVLLFTGVPFPKNFSQIAKTILKRLFRVYAHIYHQHFPEVVRLREEAHLNTSFKHFIFFVQVSG